jgi:hypothetical protein
MVAVRDKIARIPPTVDYDRMADVLYVSLGKPVPDEGEDRPQGIVLRFAIKDNIPTGVTVIGFRRNKWDRNLLGLSEIIGTHLMIDPVGVQYALLQELKE